jgi:hypothetical protein
MNNCTRVKIIMMRQFLVILFLISSFLSSAQVQVQEKEQQNSPATNNVIREETVQEDEIESLKKAKSSVSSKQMLINSVSASLSITISQASRMETQRSYTEEQKKRLADGVQQLKSIDKNSFEYNLYNYLKKPYNFEDLSSLRKAESLNAYDYSVLTSFAAYYQIQGNSIQLKQYLAKLDQGKYFDEELIDYANLTLKSLPENTVLITHGKNDTYPLLIQQKIKNSRTDVEIINLDHLISGMYRDNLKNKGFKLPSREKVDVKFLSEFVSLNKGRRLVCANSIPKVYLKGLPGKLDVTGYSFSISDLNYSNIKFYENQLVKELPRLIQRNNNIILSNSLPLLFDVRNEYINQSNGQKRIAIDEMIRLIGNQLGRTSQINSLLK